MKKLIRKVDFWTVVEVIGGATTVMWLILLFIGMINMTDGATMRYMWSGALASLLGTLSVHEGRSGGI